MIKSITVIVCSHTAYSVILPLFSSQSSDTIALSSYTTAPFGVIDQPMKVYPVLENEFIESDFFSLNNNESFSIVPFPLFAS